MTKSSVSIIGGERNSNEEEVSEDILLAGVRAFLQCIMEEEVELHTGAARHEKNGERLTHRNGYREREWITRLGNILLKIPRVRKGSYFPSFLTAHKRSEKAMFAVVREAYVKGVSTRKIDDLVKSLGVEQLDKSAVSRICAELDEEVKAFRNRPLDDGYVYLWLDATCIKVRDLGRVVNKAVVVAMAARKDGEREILGFDIGPAESEAFWKDFLRSLCRRGLKDLKLVVSDAHEGLKNAISSVFSGASWQRCRVHFMRNVLSRVPRRFQQLTAASVKTIFLHPGPDGARDQLREVAGKLEPQFPDVSRMLEEAQEDILAYCSFPAEHHTKIWSTNPIERLNKEIKRRTKVIGLFPNIKSAMRLVGAILLEQNEQWMDTEKKYLSNKSMRELLEGTTPETKTERHIPDQAGIGR